MTNFGFFNVSKSGTFEVGCPSGNQIDIGGDVGSVGSERGGTARNSVVFPCSWRRARWLRRRELATRLIGLGPSFGGASVGVDCGNSLGLSSEEASEYVVSDVDTDVLVDGRRDGHVWCHKRAGIGHSTCRGSDGVMDARPVVSCCQSSCLLVCPPPARSAPGSLSFLSCFFLLPPTHSAIASGDVGNVSCSFGGGCVQDRPLFADDSVARPVFLFCLLMSALLLRMTICIPQVRLDCRHIVLLSPVAQ